MPPAVVPGPPRIPPGLTEDAAVDWLLKAYRGAVAARTGKACWVLSRAGEARKSKHWAALKAAAEKLTENEWSPGAWVLWRLDSWAQMNSGKKPAPLHWVFSEGAMDEHADWFSNEAGHYAAPRAIYNRFAQDMLRRYSAMQTALITACAVTPEEVAAVVREHFPADTYARRIALANRHTQEDQKIINLKVQRGDWCW